MLLILVNTTTYAQDWINVGGGIAFNAWVAASEIPEQTFHLHFGKQPLALDKKGIPYFTYHTVFDRATVEKFDGLQWDNVGQPNFSDSTADFLSIAISETGTPYVIYQDASVGYNATVEKFENGHWLIVGKKGFPTDTNSYSAEFGYSCLSISSDGTPYMAYTGKGHDNKVTVMKFNGQQWVAVGDSWFSAGAAGYVSLAISNQGIPFVSYIDEDNQFKASVQEFNGNHWVYVGQAGFSEDTVLNTDLAINKEGQPYIIYQDLTPGGNSTDPYSRIKATVEKYNGNKWVTVGKPGISVGWARWPSIAIDNKDVPYVIYEDIGEYGLPAIAKKFDGKGWKRVGNRVPGILEDGVPGILGGEGVHPSIAIDNNGIPYALYYTPEPVSVYWGIVVKRFNDGSQNGIISTCGVNVYPNPNHGAFLIQGSVGVNVNLISISIADITGRVVYQKEITASNSTIKYHIDLKGKVAEGLYMVHLNYGTNNKIFKVIISP